MLMLFGHNARAALGRRAADVALFNPGSDLFAKGRNTAYLWDSDNGRRQNRRGNYGILE